MKCPTDNATLVMSERSGIEIDYCPECRGVWLDRGELDKIVDRAAQEAAPTPKYAEPRYDDRSRSQQPYRKKKGHWLGELFD
ncbi:zf-TFIIB domain-containing protein [Aeromicrobium panaciterrae]|uniref:TFIIB-type zinc ribbon-containing protein n=1 Tax=Aeromicrobium panaciterrae TaxID=363861 RepID=UPI0031D3714E